MKVKLPHLGINYLESGNNYVRQLIDPKKEIDGDFEKIIKKGISGFLLKEATSEDSILIVGNIRSIPSGYEKIIKLKKKPETVPIDLSDGEWAKHPELDRRKLSPISCSEVIDSWKSPFPYQEENTVTGDKGLRSPQVGALHAVHSHWTVSDEAATIVMPTGTGKTETMLSVLLSKGCSRVLVVVPTDALRSQISEKFLSLGILKEHGLIPGAYNYPIIGVLKEKPANVAELDAIFEVSNVIITTINIAGQLSDELQKRLVHHCEYLFIDEAHHIGARTWKGLKERFKKRHILQFTATPFRNDGLSIDGKVIFKYPLKKALKNGYFKKINFKPVSEFDPEKVDQIIAEKAVEQLRSDPANHILMARVNTIPRAKAIFEIYKQYTEFNPIQVHTGISSSKREEIKKDLISGRSRIVVCVDMLGEGFDLPELKVAAFHDIRKSLAVTLQLAGRFTRSRSDLGEPTFIANIADVSVRDELKKLYEQDADWNLLLEQTSEEVIGGQVALHQFAEGFADFPSDIPLQNLYPATSTVIYKTKCTEWNPENFEKGIRGLGSVDKIFSSVNAEEKTLIVVTAKKVPVDWIRVNEVFNWDWELYIAYWSSEKKLLFIHSSSNAGYFASLARAIAGEDVELIQDDTVFRSLAGIKRLLLYNVGLKRQLGRLIRYTMQAGSDVEAGLSTDSKKNVTKSNLFGAGYEMGKKTSIGCSRKGRIWSRRVVNIESLVRWCDLVGAKVIDESLDPDEILKGTLKPKVISVRPTKIPIRIDWPEVFYQQGETNFTFIFSDSNRVPLYVSDIFLKNPSGAGDFIFTVSGQGHSTDFSLSLREEEEVSVYDFKKVGGKKLQIYYQGSLIALEKFFNENQPSIWFADGSSLEGNLYTELNSSPALFPEDKIEVWDWTGTSIRKESQGVNKDADSIQYKVIQKLLNEDYQVIVNDDGQGEAADIIAVSVRKNTTGEEYVEADLFHCKYSSEDLPGARVKDLYEVCGQAQRSAIWKESSAKLCSHLLRRDPLKENGRTVSRFEKGDKNLLEKISRMSEVLEFKMNVFIVQPGISKSRISDEQKKLLGVTENYLIETYELPLKIITSS